ncbi:MAG: UbiD family decarboxylase [Armatimonadota bacterium]|nr:UbiD family decarboxylase [Armatimonadota bacterium]MDR7533769.1 UbiD family decarboxylase [Armatimonadota bacterium]MDR7535759.1 UbiD family decarboxylase [Armatimonadota bacterium]
MNGSDLRGWLRDVEALGELTTVRGAHWDLEIGTITELVMNRHGPALLFDNIPGYPSGHRVVTNALGGPRRLALTLGLPVDRDVRDLLRLWQQKQRTLRPVPPRVVADGPVMAHVYRDDAVDLLTFPTPRWHELDGGRYIGTGSVDITRDPDQGWVNLGCYRVMLHDRHRVGFYISPGKHGRIHRDKWFARREPMPVAMSFGHAPLIFLAGGIEIPWGLSEYEWCGAVQGAPVEVIEGPVTGLPIPAHAEIAIEGFVDPDERAPEGPFGEWTGYYASEMRAEPVVRVVALYHRDDPIILGSPPTKPPSELAYFRAFLRAAAIEEQLAAAGVPDVQAVWCHEVGGSRLLNVVAIRQRFPGHARQAALVATQCHAAAYLGRFTVVVDEDVDVMNLEDVLWAVCTRCDPAQDIEILRRCWSGPLDPIIPPERKGFNSRAIIDATRPFEWRDRFPPVAQASPTHRAEALRRWGHILFPGEQGHVPVAAGSPVAGPFGSGSR